MDYYTILTDAGRALEAAALAGKAQYTLTTCALGDGTAMPDPAAAGLQNEVWRGPISSLAQDDDNPTWLVIETNIPPADGGFTIREFGIYTDGGVLFAVGNYPETYKPAITEGTGVDLVIRPICQVSNATTVTLLTDTSVMMASKKYVDEQIRQVKGRNIGEVYYYQGRTAPFGALVADGTLVSRTLYPDLWAFAQAHDLVISETDWQKQATAQGGVGMYSSGDGTTTFRLPRLTDFIRGAGESKLVGTWQGDAIRNITGVWGYTSSGQALNGGSVSGAAYWRRPNAVDYPKTATSTAPADADISFDASRVVPTAAENRPKTLFLLPCIHAYSAVIPRAQADMHDVLTVLADKEDRIKRLSTALTIYVRKDGSDDNNGLTNTPEGACLTVVGALKKMMEWELPITAQWVPTITISVGPGTYNETVDIGGWFRRARAISLQSTDANNQALIESPSGGFAVFVRDSYAYISNICIASNLSCLGSLEGGVLVLLNNVTLIGRGGGYGLTAEGSGIVGIHATNLSTQGTFFSVFRAVRSGSITKSADKLTVNLNNVTTTQFVEVSYNATAVLQNMAFSGTATGKRFFVNTGGCISTAGAGINYFPGNTAGFTDAASYGSYL